MELPFDVEVEILLRLSVQPLRRLELVSKQWRSRDFMERYLVHQKSRHRFTILANVMALDRRLARKICRELPRLIRSPGDDDPAFSYVGLLESNEGAPCLSCDGFICCRRPGDKFLFINLATHQLIQAEGHSLCHRPQTFESLPFDDCGGSHLILHRLGYNHVFHTSPSLGFGRDRVSGDYKLVRLFEPPGETRCRCTGCELLSLKARKWIYISPVPIPCYKGQPSASVNGSIYWFTVNLWLRDATKAKIIAFDLHTHRFRAVHHHPFGARKPSYVIQLLNLRDQLWIVEQELNCVEMWSMDRGGDAWGKVYSIDIQSFLGRANVWVLMPIEICGDGKVLIIGRERHYSRESCLEETLLKYDPRSKTFLLSDRQTFAYGPNFQTWVLAPYFQSLFSLNTTLY